jgi:mTERF domain-containing protein
VLWCYSLEKRIIPRCSVVQVLLLKGSTNENFSLSYVLFRAEERFLKIFVTKHLNQVPQLLSVYQGKVDVQDA